MMLDGDDVEAIARRVAQLLQGQAPDYLDAAGIAARFGVGRAWVYAHKDKLGAVRLGSGPRARLRFDVRRVEALLQAERPAASPQRGGRGRRPVAVRSSPKRPVLEYEGRDLAA
jgi:hypothetical protein